MSVCHYMLTFFLQKTLVWCNFDTITSQSRIGIKYDHWEVEILINNRKKYNYVKTIGRQSSY